MNSELQALSPTVLREIAWRSWSAGGVAVAVDEDERAALQSAVAASTLIEDEQGLRFADVATLVGEATAFLLAKESAALTRSGDACFRRLSELWMLDKLEGHSLPGAVLTALHNEGRVDGYAFARQAIEAGIRAYEVVRVLEEAISSFAYAHGTTLFQFFGGEYGSNRHLPAGTLYPKIEPWLLRHPDIVQEIKRLHEGHPQEKGWALYASTLHALVTLDFAGAWPLVVAAVETSERLISGPALHVLGTVDYSEPAKAGAAADAIRICTQIVRNPQHPLLGQAVGVLGHMIATHEALVVPLLDEAGRAGKPEAFAALANILLRDARGRWREPWFWPLAVHLTRLSPAHTEILSVVDMMLNGWLKDAERAPRVLEFMNLWMAQQSREALKAAGPEAAFDSTIYGLIERPALFSRLITTWLLDADRRYPYAAYKIIAALSVARVRHFTLAPDLLDSLSEDELRFLVRRIIGYLMSEDVLLTLIFSMVRTGDAKERTFGLVTTVLRDYVARDYPDATLKFLKGIQDSVEESEDVRSLCASVSRDLEALLAELEALPDVREFHPPAVKVNRFLKERRLKMNDAMENASKNSIWRQVATEIPLKGGIRTFHSREGQYSRPMELKPISHSIAIPLSEVSDPLGSARERLQFRRIRKPAS